MQTDFETFLQDQFAKPMTHRVTTVFEGGGVRTHDARSLGAAENWATGERRKIGRNLIVRETGEIVRVIAVTVDKLEG